MIPTATTRRPPPSGCLRTSDTTAAAAEAWRMIERPLRKRVQRLTTDPDLQEDWLQEARISLWEIDPTRFDLHDKEERRYLRKMLLRRIWKLWEKELRAWTAVQIARPVVRLSEGQKSSWLRVKRMRRRKLRCIKNLSDQNRST